MYFYTYFILTNIRIKLKSFGIKCGSQTAIKVIIQVSCACSQNECQLSRVSKELYVSITLSKCPK